MRETVRVAGDLERAIDELYAGDPDAFTAARDSLSADLKRTGDADAAKRVKALRKPVRSAWAVNRLVREDPNGVRELAAVGERLRLAQRRALSGAGAEELRDRSEERRKLVGRLTRRAAALLSHGEPPAAAVEDISATLEAASIEEESASVVLGGRLVKPLPRPAGFGDVGGLTAIPGGGPTAAPKPNAAEERAERRKRERELRAAEERERKATARVERLRAEFEELESRASATKEELRAAEAEVRGAAVETRRLRR